jgi:hypothetical protein
MDNNPQVGGWGRAVEGCVLNRNEFGDYILCAAFAENLILIVMNT